MVEACHAYLGINCLSCSYYSVCICYLFTVIRTRLQKSDQIILRQMILQGFVVKRALAWKGGIQIYSHSSIILQLFSHTN